MDDGEVDFSNQELFANTDFGDIPGSCSMDSFFDEILKDTCTHTHTCNPPGPDLSHTHTCFHMHTKIVSAPSEDKDTDDESAESSDKKSKKRPSGNREAVRKYREKKKARAASLEAEVVKLRTLNQQLMKKLQGQAALEAEIARLKCLLVDIRGRIEGEIGSFPYQKPVRSGEIYPNMVHANVPGSYMMNPCNIQCDDQVYCLHPGSDGKSGEGTSLSSQGVGVCEFENFQCVGDVSAGLQELPGCELQDAVPANNSRHSNRRKGGARTATS